MPSRSTAQSIANRPQQHPMSGNKNPRYLWLHDCLLQDIQEGKYPIGGAFPTEEQLAAQYQVSRHTVREATRRLSESGLINRRRSTGTVVTAKHPTDKPYVAALGSFKELMDYTLSTQLDVFGQSTVKADQNLATCLGCEPGSTWVKLNTHRLLVNKPEPISYTEVYFRPEYADIADHLRGRHPSILELHDTLYHEPVMSVVQRIEAAVMPRAAARNLGLSASALTLKMTRIYQDKNDRVMSASQNFYIPERFELVTRWDRGEQAPRRD